MAGQTSSEGYELNLEEYWHVILRRRWLILFSAFSLGLFSWLFTGLHQPPAIYSSTAQVKIDQSTDMTGLLMQGLMVNTVDHIETQLELIESYALMERVAKRMKLLPVRFTSHEVRSHPGMMQKILELKNNVSAEQEGASGVISITTTGDTPQFARDLASAAAEEFRIYNIEEKNRRITDAKKFIEGQLKVVGERLHAAEDAVRVYQQENRAALDVSEGVLLAQKAHKSEKLYAEKKADLRALERVLKSVEEAIGQGGWNFKSITLDTHKGSFLEQLNNQLSQLAIAYTQLSTNYTDLHPKIQILQQEGSQILDAMLGEVTRQIAATRLTTKQIKQDMALANSEYRSLPDQSLHLNRLKREVRTNEILYNELKNKYQEVLIKEAEKVQEVSIIRPALISYARTNPVLTRQSAIAGFILGLVLGLIISLVLEALDTSVGSIEEVEGFLEIPVVGFIPQLTHEVSEELFASSESKEIRGSDLERRIRLVSHFAPTSTFAEAYRAMRANVMFSQTGEHRVVLITSSTIKEGKSTVSANLAVIVAQQGARVLLIDADLRKPMQHRTFGIHREPGLSSYLMGQKPWQECVQGISDVMLGDFGVDEALMTPGLDQLDLIVCGRHADNPADLLTSPAMAQLIEEVREEYDLVIVDMPPLLHTADASMVAGKVDGILLVYHIGAVARAVLKRVKNNIESVGGKVLGTVINGVRGGVSLDYSKFKMDRYYAYAYGQEGEEQESWIDRINARLTDALSSALRWVRVSNQRRYLAIALGTLLAALIFVGIRSAIHQQSAHPKWHTTQQDNGTQR